MTKPTTKFWPAQYAEKKVEMKMILNIALVLLAAFVNPATLQAQSFTVSNDSVQNTMDISGSFNNAEVHLPAVKKRHEFPGGKKAWQDFLRTHINIAVPVANRALPGTYQVMVRFMVGSDGKLTAIGADSNAGYGMESEVIRCVKKSPDWIPAETSSGKKARFTLRHMVTFIVKPNDVTVSF